jgi:hypothetical protein
MYYLNKKKIEKIDTKSIGNIQTPLKLFQMSFLTINILKVN